MASKKKRPSPRPQSGSRPPAKRPGQPSGKGASAPKAGGQGAAQSGQAARGGPAKAAASGKAVPKPARERTGPTRTERLAAAEKARRRKAARTRALIAGGLAAVLALLTITIINSRRSDSRVISALEDSGACNYDTRADDDGGTGRNHVSCNIAYQVDPPSGGNHNPTAAPAGRYTMENRPPDAQIVHALEHGFVVIWYRPDLDAAGVGQLEELADRHGRAVLLVPRPSLSQPVAATAWHRRLLCSRPDVAALETFITEFQDEGPEQGCL